MFKYIVFLFVDIFIVLKGRMNTGYCKTAKNVKNNVKKSNWYQVDVRTHGH